MPTMAHPDMSKSPPTGVIGPRTFFGPTSRQSRYMLPENRAVPRAMTLPPDHDPGGGGDGIPLASTVDRARIATACRSW